MAKFVGAAELPPLVLSLPFGNEREAMDVILDRRYDVDADLIPFVVVFALFSVESFSGLLKLELDFID